MNTFETISLVLNLLFASGGLITIITLRATRKKADTEAKKAEIDTEASAMENFQKYIVDPLKNEVAALRQAVAEYKAESESMRQEIVDYKAETESLRNSLNANNREMAKFRRAIEKVSECEYEQICPVKKNLKGQEK